MGRKAREGLYFLSLTTTSTVLQLFVQDYLGEPVPEETFTLSHLP